MGLRPRVGRGPALSTLVFTVLVGACQSPFAPTQKPIVVAGATHGEALRLGCAHDWPFSVDQNGHWCAAPKSVPT